MTPLSPRDKIARNEALPCEIDGCYKHRRRLSRFCGFHRGHQRKNGHPMQKGIRDYTWRTEQEQVRELLAANPSHRGVALATRFLNDWLHNRGRFSTDSPAAIERARLRRGGVQPLDVITTAAAMYLFALRNPAMLPDDERLTFALARAVLRLAPHVRRTSRGGLTTYQRPGALALREIGGVLRGELGVLFHNVAGAVQNKDERARDFQQTLAAPFGIAEGNTKEQHK
jgi:hypothetical protein